MKSLTFHLGLTLTLGLLANPALAQRAPSLGDNAALRYWSAFAQMQDSGVTDQQAKLLNEILAGTAPYDDSKFKDLAEKNRAAVETMVRGTKLPQCDWGIESELREDAPVDFVRKSLALGRLNVLFAFHLLKNGDKDGAVHALVAGLRFSHDVSNGGTLFATAVAKDLLVTHLGAVSFALKLGDLNSAQRTILQKAMTHLGNDGLPWQSAMQREMAVLDRPDKQFSEALHRVGQAYVEALRDPSTLPRLQQLIASSPSPLRDSLPNPQRVLAEKQNLVHKLAEIRSLFQNKVSHP